MTPANKANKRRPGSVELCTAFDVIPSAGGDSNKKVYRVASYSVLLTGYDDGTK